MSRDTKTQGKIWVFYDTLKNKKTKPLTMIQAQAMLLTYPNKSLKKILIWTPGWPKWIPLDKFLNSRQRYFMISPELTRISAEVDDKTIKVDLFDDDKTYSLNEETAVTVSTDIQYTKIMNDEHPEVHNPNEYGYYAPDFSADNININVKPNLNFAPARKAESEERRGEPRLNYKIEVTLVSHKGKTFKSYSDNISLSGILLQDSIPTEFLKSAFNVILTNRFETQSKKNRIHVDGRVIGDIQDPRRLKFMNLEERVKASLEEMLKSYALHQKSSEKMKKTS